MNRIPPFFGLIVIFMFFGISQQAWGVDCSDDNITLTTQLQVDNFQATYGSGGTCDRAPGELRIGGEDITNLNGLSDLTSVAGSLTISNNTSLTHLDDLSDLNDVGWGLTISNNTSLVNLDGLANLTNIYWWLVIDENTALTNIDGLINLTKAGSVIITDNAALADIDGLANLSNTKTVGISNNDALTNINGLIKITSLIYNLVISDNDDLVNIDGLVNLSSVGDELEISNNTALSNLNGLATLTDVGLNLLIDDNESLTNISGLVNLTNIGFILRISGNTALSNIDGLDSLTGLPVLRVFNNAALSNIDGLAHLTNVIQEFEIYSNPSLANINGLIGLTNLTGDLAIYDNESLTNINGLANLTSASGILEIRDNPVLANIDGLVNLTNAGDGLYIRNNALLTHVDGLSSLSSASGAIVISGNASIANINGLLNLTSIGGLVISGSPLLTHIDGLANVSGAVGGLNIFDNANLTNINALRNLKSVGFDLNISNNPELTNLAGLKNVTSIGRSLTVHDNPALDNVDGLASLATIGWYLKIYENETLTNINGLNNLGSVSEIDIRNNPALTYINGLSNVSNVNGSIVIWENPSLVAINGLQSVSAVYSLIIGYNDDLSQVNGFNSLAVVEGNLRIHDNANLTSIDGFLNLTLVKSDLDIIDNASLINIDALSNLTQVSGTLLISNNGNLTNIDGLISLTHANHFYISNNDALENIDGLINLISVSGNIGINGNDALNSINGLVNLISAGGYLEVRHNDILTHCSVLGPFLGWPDGSPYANVGGQIIFSNNALGCSSLTELLDSVSLPDAPTITSTEVDDGQVTLNFPPATTSDTFWGVTGYEAECAATEKISFQNISTQELPGGSSITSILNISGVSFRDAAGLSVAINITHPLPHEVTVTLTSPNGTSITLWDESTSEGENLIGTFPTDLVPTESLNAFDDEDFNGAWRLTLVNDPLSDLGTLNAWGIGVRDTTVFEATSADSPVLLTGLSNNKIYDCAVSAVSELGPGPASNTVSVMPMDSLGASFQINAGLNDAWYYPVTDGQGFFITVFPDLGRVVASWFTYDTVRPADHITANLGEPGHRWFNATGAYSGNQAVMTIKMASGGIFDTPTEIDEVQDGTIILTFTDCNSGIVEYDIPSIDQSGFLPIQRVAGDNISLCETLLEQAVIKEQMGMKGADKNPVQFSSNPVSTTNATLTDMNPGLNDAWYYPATDGQGFFITVFPDLERVVTSWFTYDTVRPDDDVTANLGEPGHRWFNASGRYEGNQATMTINTASGGLFDTSTEINRGRNGTMVLTFDDCNRGTVEYYIPSIDRSGVVPIQRVAGDNIGLCEQLSQE